MSAARNLTPAIDASTLPESERIRGIVYGPVQSRRLGRSLGINLLGTQEKICSFDCSYCELGSTKIRLNQLKADGIMPSLDEISEAVTAAFKEIHANGPAIDTICLSGNGEPTLHPQFAEAVKVILTARDLWLPGRPVTILTNGATLDSRKVVDALNSLDRRIVKMDSGNEKVFKAMNSPLSRTTIARILLGLRSLKDVTIQSLFVQGAVDNTRPSDIDDWIEVIAMIKPIAVQIHGLSHRPPMSGLVPCDEDTLYVIASRLERKTGIKALVTL